MSRLSQLQELAERFPIYFSHTYNKELQRAQIRNEEVYQSGCQGEQPEVEGEWTETEIKQERNRLQEALQAGIGVPKNRRKGVRKRPK